MVLFDFFTKTEDENVLICQTPFLHYWQVLLALHGHEIFILIHESSLFQLLLVSNWSRFHRYYYFLFFLPWMDTPFLSSRLLFNVKMKNFSLQKYFLYSLERVQDFICIFQVLQWIQFLLVTLLERVQDFICIFQVLQWIRFLLVNNSYQYWQIMCPS